MSEVIDDKWAAVWPRRWVMVRYNEKQEWKGPYRLLGHTVDCFFQYSTDKGAFGQCRPATSEEIATIESDEKATEEPKPSKEAGSMNEVINDKWAAVWPRRWVMVRDAASEEWSGPVQLAFVDSDGDCFCSDTRWYGKRNCRPATPEEIATVEPLEAMAEEPKLSDEMARHLELKRLAEIAWAAFLAEGYNTETSPSTFAADAWAFAEFMLIESERRRPKQ